MFQQPTTLSAELRCPVCKNIFQQPYILCCGHSFCLHCIQNCIHIMGWHCPLCKTPFTKSGMMRDQLLTNTLEEEQVRCLFPNCTWSGTINECKLHYCVRPFKKGLSELLALNYKGSKKIAKRKWYVPDSSIKKFRGFEDCN